MRNFVQPGHNVTVTAPSAGVSSGDGVLIGALFGIACGDAAANAEVEISTVGVYDLAKATGAIAAGAKVYWDSTAKNVTATSTNNTLIGVATAAAGSSDATARVRLNGAFI